MIVDSYSKYLDARYYKKAPQKTQQIYEIQQAVYDCLWEYATDKKDELEFPKEVAADLAFAMRDVIAGFLPDIFTPKKKGRGKRILSPTAEECIKSAATYVLYCKAGIIKDKSYNKTICQIYKVKPPTVRSWVKDQRFSNLKTNKDLSESEKEKIIRMMKFSGKYYPNCETTGSHFANRKRALKK